MKGFKQQSSPSTKSKMHDLEKNLQNAQMAVNVTQQMTKQLMNSVTMLSKDSNNILNLANDLQYRTLAMIKLLNVDVDELDKLADAIKLEEYNKLSDEEDVRMSYSIGDVVKEESIVIITSTTDTEHDQGIFRSKIGVSQVPYPEMKKDLIGKKVGDKFDADIQGVLHHIEVLGIRELPQKLEIVEEKELNKCANKDCKCDNNCGDDCACEDK